MIFICFITSVKIAFYTPIFFTLMPEACIYNSKIIKNALKVDIKTLLL
jgi:hypothetical protein